MLTPQIRQAVLIGAFALLAVVALLGWTRDSRVSAGSTQYLNPQLYTGAHGSVQSTDIAGRPTYGNITQAGQQVYGPGYSAVAPAEICLEPEPVPPLAYAQPVETRYRTYDRPRVVRQVVYEQPATERVVERRAKKRSTGKSVAIVAGSAGVGAAIGGLAGGGKGAGIGALTGGAAGFIYDRLTHNR